MVRSSVMLGAAAMALAVAMPAATGYAKSGKAADVAAAIAAPGRPADDIALDAGRMPVQVLGFEGLREGDQVADIMAGSGYYTEIMARAVGPKGHVTAYNPAQFSAGDAKEAAAWDALKGREHNASLVLYPFESFQAPAKTYDFVMIHLDYHDLYWSSEKYKLPQIEPAAFLKTLYASVKPGGTVAVIDHVANPGDTRTTVDKLHRIDPETVKADFMAAGFVLDGSSDMLRNTTDDHSKLVFDPAVRGKTDRFVFRFKRPK